MSAPSPADQDTCLHCGHTRLHHEHWRRGSDCSRCPCSYFVRDSWLNRLLARIPRRNR